MQYTITHLGQELTITVNVPAGKTARTNTPMGGITPETLIFAPGNISNTRKPAVYTTEELISNADNLEAVLTDAVPALADLDSDQLDELIDDLAALTPMLNREAWEKLADDPNVCLVETVEQ